jgi:hypothetical protein
MLLLFGYETSNNTAKGNIFIFRTGQDEAGKSNGNETHESLREGF